MGGAVNYFSLESKRRDDTWMVAGPLHCSSIVPAILASTRFANAATAPRLARSRRFCASDRQRFQFRFLCLIANSTERSPYISLLFLLRFRRLRGRPPSLPFARAARALASLRAIPPSRPSCCAAGLATRHLAEPDKLADERQLISRHLVERAKPIVSAGDVPLRVLGPTIRPVAIG